eukprot:TRINITY_DN25975_c0_g1_i1.p2 TRINITY_DN25975_c0_g1~~TRINITY_DN25975_c0_g1_i1.p2  ORF type:complete len:207 (-),score=39.58 TRINITY_DN25975_c0_g1_i1:793-1413(-)
MMPLSKLIVALVLVGTLMLLGQVHGMPVLNVTDHNDTGTETCLVIDARSVFEDEVPTTIPASVLLLGCVEAENTTFTFNAGKINMGTLAMECKDVPLFSLDEGDENTTLPLRDMPLSCVNETCVAVSAVNQTVFLSALLSEEEVETLREEEIEIPFLVTEVLYDFEDMLEQFALSLIDAFLKSFTDPIALRTVVFLGSAEKNCSLV